MREAMPGCCERAPQDGKEVGDGLAAPDRVVRRAH